MPENVTLKITTKTSGKNRPVLRNMIFSFQKSSKEDLVSLNKHHSLDQFATFEDLNRHYMRNILRKCTM